MDGKENGGLPVSACTLRKYDVNARQHYHVEHAGLTKRELFAAMAMQAMLGSDLIIQHSDNVAQVDPNFHRADWMASQSCKFADAILAALNAEESK